MSEPFESLVNEYLTQFGVTEPQLHTSKTQILDSLLTTREMVMNSTLRNFLMSAKTSVSPQILMQKVNEIQSWNNDYDTLIWLWAEAQLKCDLHRAPTEEEIRPKALELSGIEKDLKKVQLNLAMLLV